MSRLRATRAYICSRDGCGTRLLSGGAAQRVADVKDGAELRRAQRALTVVLAQAAQVEGVAAQEVHRRQLQRRARQRALAALKHTRLPMPGGLQ